MTSFLSALVVLFGVIVIVNFLGKPKKAEEVVDATPKRVETYQIGDVPTVTVQAKVKKTGVVTVYAQTPGVVQRVGVSEGNRVNRGGLIVSLSSSYSGGNSASISRQIAEKSYENALASYQTQTDLIDKRRELAEKTDENSDKLRELSRDTLERTKNSLSLNEEILEAIDGNISALEALPQSEETDALILSTKQLKSQFVAAVNGLRDGVESIEATSDDDDPAARLSDLGKDISLMGLDLERKGLDLSLEIAGLNVKLAKVGEAMFYPTAPFSGVVDQVFVAEGEVVNPGQPLASLVGDEQSVKAVAMVSRNIANNISRFEPSKIFWGLNSVESVPQHVAVEPSSGDLYAVTWCDLDNFSQSLSNRQYVRVEIPVGYSDTNASVPYLPLDTVYQTQDEAYVFVSVEGKVESRQVRLGQVFGSFVEVVEGIGNGDEVVLDRTVVTGDLVEAI